MTSLSQHDRLRRRLRALMGLLWVLVPTFCAFPVLAFISSGVLRWSVLVVWLLISGVLGWLGLRLQRTLQALAAADDSPPRS